MTKYNVIYSTIFKKEFKLMQKRGYDTNLLKDVVTMLANGKELPERNRDHELMGNFKGCRECHIKPDWLLIYQIQDEELILYLTRTGTHSDLF